MKYTREQLMAMAWVVMTDRTGKGDRVVAEVARRTGMTRRDVAVRLVKLALG